MARHENPYRVVLAIDNRRGKRGNILQATFCDTLGAARSVQEASEAGGEYWWADHEIKPVNRPLRTSELAYMLVA